MDRIFPSAQQRTKTPNLRSKAFLFWTTTLFVVVTMLINCTSESASNLATKSAAPGSSRTSDKGKQLGPFIFQIPSGWIETEPSSRMRKAQFTLPRSNDDSEDGELTVFYFGSGQGGSTEANINRWIGQISQPDGSSSRAKAKIISGDVSGFKITQVDVSGTLQASRMPGVPQRPAKTGYRLLGVVLESPEGPWFFKLVVPEKTIERWAVSFQKFIESAKSN